MTVLYASLLPMVLAGASHTCTMHCRWTATCLPSWTIPSLSRPLSSFDVSVMKSRSDGFEVPHVSATGNTEGGTWSVGARIDQMQVFELLQGGNPSTFKGKFKTCVNWKRVFLQCPLKHSLYSQEYIVHARLGCQFNCSLRA